ncbi:iron-sulfur cluster assembly accessory protein [Cytophagaceae bacterium ABcell3]|nr:iron-sulfur cluster assembly accessory protein [Cytophagaceae bacterium ABcell3]
MTKDLPFSFTEAALKEIKNIINHKNVPLDYGLRVGIRGGGCSGMSYLLGFDQQSDQDLVYFQGEIKIFLEKKHAMYIIGKTIDFEDGINARGFIFKD